MERFDGWSARYCGDALAMPGTALAHFRTKGSKNGVRRYQEPDGTWTPLGLRLRKAREGWGETRAERKLAKAKAKTQRIKAKEAARTKIAKEKEQVRAERAKAKANRFNKLGDLSDEELRKKINRAKLEQEYRELTRSPLLKAGQNVIKSYLEGKDKREDRKLEREKNAVEMLKADAEKIRAKADVTRTATDAYRSKQQTKQEKYRFKTKKQDVKGGLFKEREAKRLEAKKELKEASTWNKLMSIHKEKSLSKIRQKEEVNKGMSFVKSQLKGLNAIRRHNTFRKKVNRVAKPDFDTPLKKEIRDNAIGLTRLHEQTEQERIRSTKAKRDADRAKYESQTAASNAESAKYGYERAKLGSQNGSENGKKKKKKGGGNS